MRRVRAESVTRLREPAVSHGLFGRVQRADRIALHVEDPQSLLDLLSA